VPTEGEEVCGYGQEDLDYVPDYGWKDPRAGVKRLGWGKGLAAKLLRVGTMVINTRVFPLELTGEQATTLIEAAYGIVTVALPKRCFEKLVPLLDNAHLTLAELLETRDAWQRIIKQEVARSCHGASNTQRAGKITSRAGKIARMQLQPLRFGLWTLYRPLTNAAQYVISVQATDRKRFPAKSFQLRQIWHYAKMHMLWKTSLQVREDYLVPSRPNADLRRIRKTVIRMASAITMANGQLDRVEVGSWKQTAEQRCYSAPASGMNTTSAQVYDWLHWSRRSSKSLCCSRSARGRSDMRAF